MKNLKWIMLLVALMLMAGTAGALTWLRVNQKLGAPGIKGTPVAGSVKVDIDLPERVLDFTSTNVPEPDVAIGYFPADTSYAERMYFAPDGQAIQSTAILMGADRTSIHRPEYCFPGQGFSIDEKKIVNIPINDQPPYQLEVARWNVSKSVQQPDGQKVKFSGIYVYWYVANGEETPDHDKMLEWLTLDLFRTGKLQRWAYISYFTVCPHGREDEAFEQVKKLIAAQVPQFQLPLKPK
jgi:Protein of unknown function (DUF3485)